MRRLLAFLSLGLGLVAGISAAADPVVPRSKTPMMDVLVLELLKGEPINDTQAKQLIQSEFGKIWNNQDPYPVDPADSKEVKSAKHHMWVYLAAVKASFLDVDQHGGWPTGYGKLRVEGFPRQMLEQLKALAATPLDPLNRTIVNYAIIVPAWLAGDSEAMASSDRQRAEDWPADSLIARRAAQLKARAKYLSPRESP